MNDRAANIIEGGCYYFPRGDPKIKRKYVVLALVIEIVAIIVTAYRLSGSKL